MSIGRRRRKRRIERRRRRIERRKRSSEKGGKEGGSFCLALPSYSYSTCVSYIGMILLIKGLSHGDG